VEAYLEDKQVFELLEGLLRKLIVHKPDDPYTFMMQRLQKAERKLHFCVSLFMRIFIAKRIFITGPPGSNRKEVALALAEHFNWSCISVGDLLKKEVSKKSDLGKTIFESLKQHKYGKKYMTVRLLVDDNVVLELVRAQVEYFEKDHTSWIIEGFPRTKSQALAL